MASPLALRPVGLFPRPCADWPVCDALPLALHGVHLAFMCVCGLVCPRGRGTCCRCSGPLRLKPEAILLVLQRLGGWVGLWQRPPVSSWRSGRKRRSGKTQTRSERWVWGCGTLPPPHTHANALRPPQPSPPARSHFCTTDHRRVRQRALSPPLGRGQMHLQVTVQWSWALPYLWSQPCGASMQRVHRQG
jgi:hypothetical protein